MGGLLAFLTAAAKPQLWTGVVLSAPALALDPRVNTPLNRALAGALSSLLPKVSEMRAAVTRASEGQALQRGCCWAWQLTQASSRPATAPQLPVTPLDASTLSADPEVVAQYQRDPLVYHGSTRIRTGAEFLRCIKRALELAPAFNLPLLVVHGSEDRLCGPEGSTGLMAVVGSGDKQLKLYDGVRHEVFFEKGGAAAVGDVAAWLRARC
jgi:alpha-beta hydrolase superfamily lysophospholipase